MKIKTQLTLASVIAAGLLASGCSQQMAAQQTVDAAPAEPVVKTVIDCSSCNKPAPKPSGNKWTHTHPAVPGCTDSMKHTHKYNNRGHKHAYSCKKGMVKPMPKPAPKPAPRPAPRPQVNPDTHTHPAIPNCTNSIRHTHPNGRRAHQHRYSCQRPAPRPQIQQPRPKFQQQPVPVMPKVKAKGTYRGAIEIDGVMQQYKQ